MKAKIWFNAALAMIIIWFTIENLISILNVLEPVIQSQGVIPFLVAMLMLLALIFKAIIIIILLKLILTDRDFLDSSLSELIMYFIAFITGATVSESENNKA